jgi:hypothetical protein
MLFHDDDVTIDRVSHRSFDWAFLYFQAPILLRLCAMIEPKQVSQNNAPKEATTGYLSILSGNRKKGTFWNAWKRKFYVVASGRLSGYEVRNKSQMLHF